MTIAEGQAGGDGGLEGVEGVGIREQERGQPGPPAQRDVVADDPHLVYEAHGVPSGGFRMRSTTVLIVRSA